MQVAAAESTAQRVLHASKAPSTHLHLLPLPGRAPPAAAARRQHAHALKRLQQPSTHNKNQSTHTFIFCRCPGARRPPRPPGGSMPMRSSVCSSEASGPPAPLGGLRLISTVRSSSDPSRYSCLEVGLRIGGFRCVICDKQELRSISTVRSSSAPSRYSCLQDWMSKV